MKTLIKKIDRKLESFQNSISRPKHFVGLILALAIFLSTAYFKETLEAIHPIIYMVLFVFSMTWFYFHLGGLKIFKSPLN